MGEPQDFVRLLGTTLQYHPRYADHPSTASKEIQFFDLERQHLNNAIHHGPRNFKSTLQPPHSAVGLKRDGNAVCTVGGGHYFQLLL